MPVWTAALPQADLTWFAPHRRDCLSEAWGQLNGQVRHGGVETLVVEGQIVGARLNRLGGRRTPLSDHLGNADRAPWWLPLTSRKCL
jgi:hypothetical protein